MSDDPLSRVLKSSGNEAAIRFAEQQEQLRRKKENPSPVALFGGIGVSLGIGAIIYNWRNRHKSRFTGPMQAIHTRLMFQAVGLGGIFLGIGMHFYLTRADDD